MNKSTGGRVLRDKTSAKDSSLFLRPLAQSPCFFSPPSILACAGNAARPAVKGRWHGSTPTFLKNVTKIGRIQNDHRLEAIFVGTK
jgi:hypothetical protein